MYGSERFECFQCIGNVGGPNISGMPYLIAVREEIENPWIQEPMGIGQ